MRAVEHRDIPQRDALFLERADLRKDPFGLGLAVFGIVAQHRAAAGQRRDEILFHARGVLVDQRVCRREDLGRGAVVLHHEDRLRAGVFLVEIEQIPHVRPAPGIDGLVRVADDEKVFVIAAQRLHQFVLRLVDVLKFVDHDVFEPLLPLQADLLVFRENIQREDDQIVIVEREAFFLLPEIAVEDDVARGVGLVVFLLQLVERKADQVEIIVRAVFELFDFDHIPRGGKTHVPQT